MSAFTKPGLLLALLFTLGGCMPQNAGYSKSSGHSHGYSYGHSHGHSHSHALHDGVVVALFADQQHVGFAELKLHDDKGDLELWLTRDEAGSQPLDLPLNVQVGVSFQKAGTQPVVLQVRNSTRNEDEDGQGNIRNQQTNYFIFPGDTGVDASFLMGKDFVSETAISFVAGGVSYQTNAFKLRPHTH